jgi:hypothetical protein
MQNKTSNSLDAKHPNKIIYSLKVMTTLVEMGFFPVHEMPNPKNPEYTCWVFERSEEFDIALQRVLGPLEKEV